MLVEDRNIFVWICIMVGGWLLYSLVSLALFAVYLGVNVGAPVAVEFAQADAGNQNPKPLSAEQVEVLTDRVREQMRGFNWWFWWPLLNLISWAVAAVFLGYMRVVQYNLGLVALAYIPALVRSGEEWQPPGSFVVECVTIVLALAIVTLVSRLVCAIRDGGTTDIGQPHPDGLAL